MDIRYDDPDLHERLIPGKESQLDHIVDASLFEIGEMFCVVDVPLRIQIPVTDFDGMVETVIAHGAIIVGQASDQLVRKDGVACCFPAPLKK
jgi:hypothetical protein